MVAPSEATPSTVMRELPAGGVVIVTPRASQPKPPCWTVWSFRKTST